MMKYTSQSVVDACGIEQLVNGYGALLTTGLEAAPDVTTDDYATNQEQVNNGKVVDYLLPLVRTKNAKTILDVGCGVGAMVNSFLGAGYDAYGVDLPGLTRHWARLSLPHERMFVIDPVNFKLPFLDDSLDFAFTLGVIEHVGTTNGHSDRCPDYHEQRRAWLREVFRVIRPGGALLIGGPNRGFPVDLAHDHDSRASSLERWLTRKAGISVHKTWGDHFLWSYKDIESYLEGYSYQMEGLSLDGFLSCARVPKAIRPMAQSYIKHLPGSLLRTGFNPWVMALLSKSTSA